MKKFTTTIKKALLVSVLVPCVFLVVILNSDESVKVHFILCFKILKSNIPRNKIIFKI